jgi:cytochrome c
MPRVPGKRSGYSRVINVLTRRTAVLRVRIQKIFDEEFAMNRTTIVCAALAAAFALPTVATANEKLAQASGCMTCHGVDKKIIGPAYKDVANKYRGNKGAEADLIKKVKGGSKGVWGDIPMPPNAHVKDEDIKTLVQWILAQK